MKKYLLVLVSFIFLACSAHEGPKHSISKAQLFPQMYAQKPKSILILPAVNSTKSAKAAREFSFTVTMPLASLGYYVFPVHLVDAYIKEKHLSHEGIMKLPALKQLKEQFNPDAIMFVDINQWDYSYSVVKTTTTVGVVYNMIDANTGAQLWANSGVYDHVPGAVIVGGPIALAIGLTVNTIVAATSALTQNAQQYMQMAYVLNSHAFYDLPRGPYSKLYMKDQNVLLSYRDKSQLVGDKIYVQPYFIVGSKIDSANKDSLCLSGVNSLGKCSGLQSYERYYREKVIAGNKYFFNAFFHYENGLPYLLSDNKKVFIKTQPNGKITYHVQIIKPNEKLPTSFIQTGFNVMPNTTQPRAKVLYYFDVLRVDNLVK